MEKFSENLIRLRKAKGWSQEELGYKLNVTRQTISKWELGQTTPEMDKLLEMTKIFGISLDELTGGKKSESIENNDKKADNSSKTRNILVVLLVIILIAIVIMTVNKILKLKSSNEDNSNNISSMAENLFGRIFDLVEKQIDSNDDMISGTTNSMMNLFEEGMNDINYKSNQIIDELNMEDKEKQENAIDLYVGTKTGGIVKVAMDKVITNNKKLSIHKVKVIFENIETEEPTEIKELKSKIDDFKQYEVSYEYDDDGYVTEMIIEKY